MRGSRTYLVDVAVKYGSLASQKRRADLGRVRSGDH